MTVLPSDRIQYRAKDGEVRTGRVTATRGDGSVLVLPDGGCGDERCIHKPGLEQITVGDIVTVNRALLE